eukprot:CAMPEP_0202922624 /NCGR_PEP_ID=MMETSP1392-20130828/78018_1 /ASSEMBLY_ACC=CAM_ASM_000868 /TAXON_ID=225041 /ORGANISM="Chlamydomonas chlamydogama, Strain SAG 11-48b" /LENGTH=167 /DNA_ID=CAMNT_0049616257 /DNA_START=801 /DNA_END=1305 /DNA_ORIENTATION=-
MTMDPVPIMWVAFTGCSESTYLMKGLAVGSPAPMFSTLMSQTLPVCVTCATAQVAQVMWIVYAFKKVARCSESTYLMKGLAVGSPAPMFSTLMSQTAGKLFPATCLLHLCSCAQQLQYCPQAVGLVGEHFGCLLGEGEAPPVQGGMEAPPDLIPAMIQPEAEEPPPQ